MIELTRDEYDVLILHIVRCPTVFQAFIDRTRYGTFDPVLYPAHDILAETMVQCHDAYGSHPGLTVVESTLHRILAESPSVPVEAVTMTFEYFEFIKTIPEEHLSPDVALAIMGKAVERQTALAARDRIIKALDHGTSLSAALKEISTDVGRRMADSRKGAKIIKPFEDPSRFMVKSEVFATGMGLFDILLNGGVERHDLIGLLAPSGGGKTTIAVQLCASWIRQGPARKALLCSYEQPLEGDIINRMLVNMTGLRSSVFRGKPMDELDPAVRDAIGAATGPCSQRFIVGDLSTSDFGLRGMADIENLAKQCGEPEDGSPLLVVLDWFLPCVQRAMAGARVSCSSSEALRLFGTQFMDTTKIWKNSNNVAMLITHQLNCEAGNANPNRKPQWGDAAEWKGFAWFPNICFGVGVLSPDNVAWWASTKVRSQAKGERLVKLDGELCRFVDVNKEYMVSSGGKFVPKLITVEDAAEAAPKVLKTDVTSQYI